MKTLDATVVVMNFLFCCPVVGGAPFSIKNTE
jgi:hypothetical protein